jgi:hypothetical protein
MRQNDASQQPNVAVSDPSRWRRPHLVIAALAGAAVLYLVIVAVTKTRPLEWFGLPWDRGDEVVVPAVGSGAAGGRTSRSTNAVAGRLVDARRPGRRPARTRRAGLAPSTPSPSGARGSDDVDSPGPDSTGRTPTAGSASPPPAAGSRTPPAQSSAPQSPTQPPPVTSSPDPLITLPPPLPPLEVTQPELPVTPPDLPVEPPALSVTPPELPVIPPTLPVTPPPTPELPELPKLP